MLLTLNGAGGELGEGGIGGGEDSQGSLAGESVGKSAGSDGGYVTRDKYSCQSPLVSLCVIRLPTSASIAVKYKGLLLQNVIGLEQLNLCCTYQRGS